MLFKHLALLILKGQLGFPTLLTLILVENFTKVLPGCLDLQASYIYAARSCSELDSELRI